MIDSMTEQARTVGFIGLGRMGLAMVERLLEQGYMVHATDVDAAARGAAASAGATVYPDITRLVTEAPSPSLLWVMVPSQFVDNVLAELREVVSPESVIIDGGNSAYGDSRRRHQELARDGVRFLDCGTSGGVEGARHGASLMIGGDAETFASVEWLFAALSIEQGYARVGGPGAGHFVKAVHNGIEYGMMGALAEGIAYLDERADEFELSVPETLKPYAHGSIISSRLLDWLVAGYTEGLPDSISGTVPVGETEQKMRYLCDNGNLPILAAAIKQRQATRELPTRAGQYLSTMRYKFGGHKPAATKDNT